MSSVRPSRGAYCITSGRRRAWTSPWTRPSAPGTVAAIPTARELSASAKRPGPLPGVLLRRCYGYSPATVRLPEGTRYATRHPGPAPPAGELPRVVPRNDGGAVLDLNDPGSHVGKRSEHLVVRRDGREVDRVPIASVRRVVDFGIVQVSTQALEYLATLEVPVVDLTPYRRCVAAQVPAPARGITGSR